MVRSWPPTALVAVALVALHGLGIARLGDSPAGSALSEFLQLGSVGLAALACIRTGRRLRGRPGRFWLLVGLGFACWTLGQLLLIRNLSVLKGAVPAIVLADVPFLLFYLPVFAALFPETDGDSGVDWARTLDLAQVGIVLGSVYLYFFFALNLGVEQRVITLHFGLVDSYSLLNSREGET